MYCISVMYSKQLLCFAQVVRIFCLLRWSGSAMLKFSALCEKFTWYFPRVLNSVQALFSAQVLYAAQVLCRACVCIMCVEHLVMYIKR